MVNNMKYPVTYKCGHEDCVDLCGPVKTRMWRLEQMEDELCPECRRKAENERVTKLAEENGLAQLSGTEKQVAWAMKLRQDILDSLLRLDKEVDKGVNNEAVKEDIQKAIAYVSERKDSKYFIDGRHDAFKFTNINKCTQYNLIELRRKLCEYAKAYDEEHSTENELERLAQEEAIAIEKANQTEVHPENQTSTTVVTIKVNDDNDVMLQSAYDKELVDTIHGLAFNMAWCKPVWKYHVRKNCGTVDAVAAEIGNKLLEAGFPVVFPTHDIAEKASSGDFERYHLNAIFKHKSNDKVFIVECNRHDDNMSKLIRGISKAKRIGAGCFHIPVASYKELEEFSEENNFFWTGAATERLNEYKQSIMTVKPKHIEDAKAVEPTRKEVDISDLNDD